MLDWFEILEFINLLDMLIHDKTLYFRLLKVIEAFYQKEKKKSFEHLMKGIYKDMKKKKVLVEL